MIDLAPACVVHEWADTKLVMTGPDGFRFQACRRCGVLRAENPPFRDAAPATGLLPADDTDSIRPKHIARPNA